MRTWNERKPSIPPAKFVYGLFRVDPADIDPPFGEVRRTRRLERKVCSGHQLAETISPIDLRSPLLPEGEEVSQRIPYH